MSWLISGAVVGLGTVLLMWLDRKKAEADRNKAQALSSYVGGDKTADLAEKEIADSAKAARDNATSDFTTLQ